MKANLIFIFLIIGTFLLFTGCRADNDAIGTPAVDLPVLKLTAGYVSNYSTRTGMDADYKVQWSAGDAINVNGHFSTDIAVSNGGLFASFSFNAATPTYYAFYPAGMVSSFDETAHTFAITLPATQAYKNNVSFSDNVNPAVAVSDYTYLGFYNVCGMLRIPITTNTTAVKARFLSADHAVAGSATVNPSDKSLTVAGNGMEVDITSLPSTGAYTLTWILPAATYGAGWRIQLLDANNNVVSQKTFISVLTIKRGYLANVKITHSFPKDESPTVSLEVTDVYIDGGSEATVVPLTGSGSGFTVAGTVWAPGNLVATPKGDGTFIYSFASTQEYFSGTWNGGDYFCWNTLSPTVTSSTNTATTYDASADPCRQVVSDGIWRMPTNRELVALKNAGSVWTIKSGINGRYFGITTVPASGTESKYLFLPAAGYRDKESTTMNQAGESGYYWSATPDGTTTAYRLYFSNNNAETNAGNYGYGHTLRCVLEIPELKSSVNDSGWSNGSEPNMDSNSNIYVN